ncbi:hypothetical protein D3C78_1923060 [compost metagenome]
MQAKLKKGGFAKQRFQVDIGVLADEVNPDSVQLTDRLNALEGQYLKVVTNAGNL